MEVEQSVEVVRAAGFPTAARDEDVASRLSATHPAVVLPRQLLLAQDRAAWLGERLRAQVEAEGVEGLVGEQVAVDRFGDVVKVSEYARVLAEQERKEREHVAVLAERMARLGLDEGAARLEAAGWIAASLMALVGELGLSMDDEPVRRVTQRAGLAGRRAMGRDDGDPDLLVGPRMSPVERVAVLRAALMVAERAAGDGPGAMATDQGELGTRPP